MDKCGNLTYCSGCPTGRHSNGVMATNGMEQAVSKAESSDLQ